MVRLPLTLALSIGVASAACTGTVGGRSNDGGASGSSKAGSGARNGGSGGGGASDGDTTVVGPALGRLNESQAKSCPSTLDPGPNRVRRLTRREYNNTIAAVLFDTSNPAASFPSDERRLNFDNNAEALTVQPSLAEAYMLTAATLAQNAVTSNYAKLVPCDPAKDGTASCSAKFLETFGKRAFRRPLGSDEIARYKKVFDQGAMTDFKTGVRLVVEAMIQSAPFLYRAELGEKPAAGSTTAPLTSWEMASRLSYFVWAGPPDDTLIALAEQDKLKDRGVVREQVARMLGDARARATTASFHEQWLSLADLVTLDKDTKMFPAWTSDMTAQLKEETSRFVDEVVWNGGKFPDLLSAPFSVVNAKVATLYGLSGSGLPTGSDWKKVSMDANQRAGVLTHGSILAMEAKRNQTNPVLRGKFVRAQLMCDPPPPPPMDLNIQAPDLDPNLTTRERFTAHQNVASCAACHKLLDPVGLGFENFDAVGKYR